MKANRFVIDLLKPEYMQSYLAHFSEMVQKTLKVESLESERLYLDHQLWAQSKGFTSFYCLLDQENVFGAIEIRNPIQFPGQLYCWLNEQYWGKNYLQEAMPIVAHDYFERVTDTAFNAHVHLENIRSYRALKKCGFIDDGIFDGPWGLQYILRYFKQ